MQGRVFSPDRRKKWVPGNKLNILLQPFTSLASYGGRSGTTAFELVYTTTVGRVGGWSVGREWRGGGGEIQTYILILIMNGLSVYGFMRN